MKTPEDIEAVTVLKDASATEKYGEAAKNGVILITSKQGAALKGSAQQSSTPTDKISFSAHDATVKKTATGKILTLKNNVELHDLNKYPGIIILDGKEITRSQASAIPAGTITVINVYSGSESINKFGKKASSGAIELISK